MSKKFDDFKNHIYDEKAFCPHPWVSFYPSPRGEVYPCCVSMKYEAPSKVREDNDVQKMMNTPQFNMMRTNMINGVRPSSCGDCWQREDRGVESDRLITLDRYVRDGQNHSEKCATALEEAVANTNSDGSIDDFKISYLEFRDNNICNYRCRFCNINSSNSWIKEFREQAWNPKTESYAGSRMVDGLNMKTGVSESGIDWNEIDLSHIVDIHMAGGEPTAMDSTYLMLEKLEAQGRNHEINVGIISNTSRLEYKKKRILDLLAKMKFVNWSVSLDGIGKIHDYLRSGGLDDWEKLDKNIWAVKDWTLERPENRSMKFHSTMNWNNAFAWWDMFERYQDLQVNVFFSTGPDGTGINDLPNEQIERIEKFYLGKRNIAPKQVDQILSFCEKSKVKNNKDLKQRMKRLARYKSETIWLDKSRNQYFVDVFPEWEDFFRSLPLYADVNDGMWRTQQLAEEIIQEPGMKEKYTSSKIEWWKELYNDED